MKTFSYWEKLTKLLNGLRITKGIQILFFKFFFPEKLRVQSALDSSIIQVCVCLLRKSKQSNLKFCLISQIIYTIPVYNNILNVYSMISIM